MQQQKVNMYFLDYLLAGVGQINVGVKLSEINVPNMTSSIAPPPQNSNII